MKKAFLLTVSFLVLGSFFINCGKEKKVKHWVIEEVDGITVVKNPSEPLYGEFSFDLEEDISIGGNFDDDNYYFPRGVSKVTIDDELNFYVNDMGNSRIQKYDRDGNYLATIGHQGQGPGEFRFPSDLILDSQGKIWILDVPTRALIVFSKEGVYEKNIPIKTSIFQFFVSEENFIFGLQIDYSTPEGPNTAILRINPDTSEIDSVAKYFWEKKENEPGFVLHHYTDRLHVSQIDHSSICYGFSSEYKIYVFDGKGETIRIIEKYEEPIPISKDEKDMTAKEGVYQWTGMSKPDNWNNLDFPSHRPFFGKIFTDDMGRIYSLKYISILDQDEVKVCDVFGNSGGYLYKLTLPFIPAVIKSGFLYEIRKDEETGEVTVVRHKITNWDKFESIGEI